MKAPADYIKKDDLAHFSKIHELVPGKGDVFDLKEVQQQQYLLIGDDNGSIALNNHNDGKEVSKFTPYPNSGKITLAKFVPGEGDLAVLGC